LCAIDWGLSLAVVIGIIAFAGLDVEPGIGSLLYLDTSFAHGKRKGRMGSRRELWEAVNDGAQSSASVRSP